MFTFQQLNGDESGTFPSMESNCTTWLRLPRGSNRTLARGLSTYICTHLTHVSCTVNTVTHI